MSFLLKVMHLFKLHVKRYLKPKPFIVAVVFDNYPWLIDWLINWFIHKFCVPIGEEFFPNWGKMSLWAPVTGTESRLEYDPLSVVSVTVITFLISHYYLLVWPRTNIEGEYFQQRHGNKNLTQVVTVLYSIQKKKKDLALDAF